MRICSICKEEFNPRATFFHRQVGTQKHCEYGRITECGPCGLKDDDPRDRVIALEEGNGTKMPCEVTPVHRKALQGGVAYYVNFSQRYQPFGK